MPFIYTTGGGLAASNTAISPFDSTTSGYYTGRGIQGTNSYWGRFSVGGSPISFDRDMSVDNYGILIFNFDDSTYPGAQARVWIYESDALGLPRTLTWDPGVLTGIGSAAGFYNKSDDAVVLEARKKYWVISQLVLEDPLDPGQVDINAEDFGNSNYCSLRGTELDPVASYAWPDPASIAFSNGYMSGLYIDELQSPGWTPGDPAPATLTGDMNDGFYVSSYITTVFLRAQEA